jgi:hypothetical protein
MSGIDRYLAAYAKPARKPRAAPRQNHEAKLQIAIVKALTDAFPETWVSHTRNNSRNRAEGARNKALGVKKGWPDLSVYPCAKGTTGYIEVKWGSITESAFSPEQKHFRRTCELNGTPWAAVNSVEDAVDAVLRFKGVKA